MNITSFLDPNRCLEKGKSPVITCTIAKEKFQALIDTGSEISVMSLQAVKKCGLESRMSPHCLTRVVGFGAKSIIGQMRFVDVKISRATYPIDFVVLESLRYDILLGADFLSNLGCTINFEENFILIGENKLKVKFSK